MKEYTIKDNLGKTYTVTAESRFKALKKAKKIVLGSTFEIV